LHVVGNLHTPAATGFSPLVRSSLARARLPEPLSHYRPGVTERINTNPSHGLHPAYPSPFPQVAARYAEVAQVAPEQVLFVPGSVTALDLLIRVFCEPGTDCIVITSPTFPVYGHYARAYGVRVADVSLGGENFDQLDVEGILAEGAKLVFLCHPSNPVGTALRLEQIEELAQRACGLVVVDEAYIEFSNVPSTAALLSKYPNLVVVRTFSKAWGLAGLRIGALLADPCIIRSIRILLDPFACTVVAQQALVATLECVAAMRESVQRVQHQRVRLTADLAALPGVLRVFPSEANFVFVQFADASEPLAALVVAGDWVADTGYQIPGTLRISTRTPEIDSALVERLRGITPR
jgi:histidinol-phosphate aminotransferase